MPTVAAPASFGPARTPQQAGDTLPVHASELCDSIGRQPLTEIQVRQPGRVWPVPFWQQARPRRAAPARIRDWCHAVRAHRKHVAVGRHTASQSSSAGTVGDDRSRGEPLRRVGLPRYIGSLGRGDAPVSRLCPAAGRPASRPLPGPPSVTAPSTQLSASRRAQTLNWRSSAETRAWPANAAVPPRDSESQHRQRRTSRLLLRDHPGVSRGQAPDAPGYRGERRAAPRRARRPGTAADRDPARLHDGEMGSGH